MLDKNSKFNRFFVKFVNAYEIDGLISHAVHWSDDTLICNLEKINNSGTLQIFKNPMSISYFQLF